MSFPSRRAGARPVVDVPPEGSLVPRIPWPLAAALAGVLTAVVGLIPPIAIASVAWVQADDISLWSTIQVGVRGWLLAHGAGAQIGSTMVSIAPLGVTVVALLTGSGLAGLAAQSARLEANIELSQRERQRLTLRVTGAFTIAYALCILIASGLVDNANQTGHALLGGVAVAMIGGVVGAGRALDWHPTALWPVWARAIPRAVAAALAVMGTTGAVVAAIALATHRSQVAALQDALGAGTAGGVVLLLLQLAWLPNMIIWCASWALGPGLSIGTGSVISPAANMSGMMPAIPVLGAVPPSGPGPRIAMLWLLSGVLAGAVAAWVVVRSRRHTPAGRAARLDEHVLVGGLAGVLAGLFCWIFGWLSNGDLGAERMVGIGARLVPLAVMAPTVMGISGLLVGLVLGWTGRARDVDGDDVVEEAAAVAEGDADERTIAIDTRP